MYKTSKRRQSTKPTPSSKKKDYKLAIKIPTSHHQIRLDHFLHNALPSLTAKALGGMVKKKEIYLLTSTTPSLRQSIQTTFASSDQIISHLSNDFLPLSTDPQHTIVKQPFQETPSQHLFIQPHSPSTTLLPQSHSINVLQPSQQQLSPFLAYFYLPPINSASNSKPNSKFPPIDSISVSESTRVSAGNYLILPAWLCHISPDQNINDIHKLLAHTQSLATSPYPLTTTSTASIKLPSTHLTPSTSHHFTPTLEQQQIITHLRSIPSPPPLPSSFSELQALFDNTDDNPNNTHLNHHARHHLDESFSPYITPEIRSFTLPKLSNSNSTLIAQPVHQYPSNPKPFQRILSDVKRVQKITLYSDPLLLCLNKPSGISVHAGDIIVPHKQRNLQHPPHLGILNNNQNDNDHENNNIGGGDYERHVDAWLESIHQLSQHYLHFTTLSNQIKSFYHTQHNQDDKLETTTHIVNPGDPATPNNKSIKKIQNQSNDVAFPSIPIPYTLSEIYTLSNIAEEGNKYYTHVAKLAFSTPSSTSTSSSPTPISPLQPTIPPVFSLLSTEKPKLAHRLDKATSGCLAIAKSRLTAKMLGFIFKSLSESSNNITTPSKISQTDNVAPLTPNASLIASKLLHKVYLALILTHPAAAVQFLASAATELASSSSPLTKTTASKLSQLYPSQHFSHQLFQPKSIKQHELTFSKLFYAEQQALSQSQNPNESKNLIQSSRPSNNPTAHLSNLLLPDPTDLKAILASPSILMKHQQESKTKIMLNKNIFTSGQISFPTAPYISKSLTQQRLSPGERKKLHTTVSKNSDKISTTVYKMLHQTQFLSLLACTPITGHFHQIRIHAAAQEGFQAPILGENKYITSNVYGYDELLPSHLTSFIRSAMVSTNSISHKTPEIANLLGTQHTLETYYNTLHDVLKQYYNINTSELHLVAHSISFPHPSILSSFFHSLQLQSTNSHNGSNQNQDIFPHGKHKNNSKTSPLSHQSFDFMPFDQHETQLAQKYLAISPHLFPSTGHTTLISSSNNSNSQSSVPAPSDITNDPNSLPMLTITCDLPPFFQKSLSAVGVNVM